MNGALVTPTTGLLYADQQVLTWHSQVDDIYQKVYLKDNVFVSTSQLYYVYLMIKHYFTYWFCKECRQ